MGVLTILSIIPWDKILKYSPIIVEAGEKIFSSVNKYFGGASKEGGKLHKVSLEQLDKRITLLEQNELSSFCSRSVILLSNCSNETLWSLPPSFEAPPKYLFTLLKIFSPASTMIGLYFKILSHGIIERIVRTPIGLSSCIC